MFVGYVQYKRCLLLEKLRNQFCSCTCRVLQMNNFTRFKCIPTQMSSIYDALSKMLSGANDISLFRVQNELVATAHSNTPLTGHIKIQSAYLCIITHNLRLENIKEIFQSIFQRLQKESCQARIHLQLQYQCRCRSMCSCTYTDIHIQIISNRSSQSRSTVTSQRK